MPALLSLCSGYGGLDLAVEEVLGATTRWVSEIDADAAAVLAARFPHAPNLGDLTIADWDGVDADIITAGYPCQPFSTAGRRQGSDDDRHIWPEVLRAVRTVRPGLVVLENVAGHLSLGFGRVLGDLAESGYVGSWLCLRAADVGAPHGRARVFIVAADADREPARRHGGADAGPQEPHAGRGAHDSDGPAHGRGVATDAEGARRFERAGLPGPPERCRSTAGGPSPWGCYAPAVERWERITGRTAPVPLRPDNPKQLNARFVEWMMGLPDGWVTDIVPNRRALKTLGNGVVPQQAAAALRTLI